MTSLIIGTFVVVAAAVLSGIGLLCVRRVVGLEVLKSYNEVAGNMFQVVGTLYAVLLGLIVVDAMSNMNDLRVILEEEANDVCDVFIIARGFHEPERTKIQTLCKQYVDAVIDHEWVAMRTATVSKEGLAAVNNLWDALVDMEPNDDDEKELKSMALDHVSEAGDNRRKRILASMMGVSTELWTVLAVGGFLTIGFSYFLGLSSVRGQVLMTAIVAVSVSLNVYLVYLFGYPFSGPYALRPIPFIADRAIFNFRTSDAYENGEFQDVKLHDVLRKHEGRAP
ncbi:MAG TPA: hypothetical protein V6D17_10515 [Candidatus Obscuribacterales bacterium]